MNVSFTLKTINSNDIKKILVRAPNWIGDAVMCLPALKAVNEIFPGAGISVLARPWTAAVFLEHPGVAEIIHYDKTGIHRGAAGTREIVRQIKSRGFDMAVLFQNAFEAAVIAFLARIPVRVGYSRDMRGPLLTHSISAGKGIKKAHQIYYYLNIAEEIRKTAQCGARCSARVSQENPGIFLTNREKGEAELFLKGKGIPEGNVIGLAPGASYGPAKRWPADRFRNLARRLNKEFGAHIILFGGRDDRGICGGIINDFKGLNLAGELDLRNSIALISRCRLFITNDSGLMHVASALGVPTVAVFGSTDPDLTGPRGERVAVIRKNISCSPCFKRECRYGHYDCLSSITEEEVFEAAAKLRLIG